MLKRVKMYHPWRKDREGKQFIQSIHPKSVNKMLMEGYTKVIEPVAPPQFTSPVTQTDVTDVQDVPKQTRTRRGGNDATA